MTPEREPGPPTESVWDEAASPLATRVARQFERDWEKARDGSRPDPRSYLEGKALPGVRLALLRAEMALRWEAGDPIRVEAYRDRFPDLDADSFVALVYEEFCVREEAGESPQPSEYYERFPDVAVRLQRVLNIHALVGSSTTANFSVAPPPTQVSFPEVGQTIDGFRLTEELGRGAFARVFRAEERQLSNRPVALKVSRTGSREPQMLARLQHTHIVPVYSYREALATGLHLLCMPYLGKVTLAHLLTDPQVARARTGQELLDALDRLEPMHRIAGNPFAAARQALARRSYVRSIAWWGARLAEALAHAHERGVLHRDLKPSNVLIAGDASPMLLDFNLAWESNIDDPAAGAASLGGTIAYMAPEHLEALAEGEPSAIGTRSDIFSLGVILYEAMGERPFGPISRGRSLITTLHTAADRRRNLPSLRKAHPEVPAEFAAVVERCLAPEPENRYAAAGDLAIDLQAVADDAALRFAREPIVSAATRWTRRNRTRISIALPLIVSAIIVTTAVVQERREHERLLDDVRLLIKEARSLEGNNRLDEAEARFDLASKLASPAQPRSAATPEERALRDLMSAGTLEDLRAEASQQAALMRESLDMRGRADTLHEGAEAFWPRLLGLTGDVDSPPPDIQPLLEPLFVLKAKSWPIDEQMKRLDEPRRTRLLREVEDLLFFSTLAIDRALEHTPEPARPALIARAMDYCARGASFSKSPEPWTALEQRLEAWAEGRLPGPTPEGDESPANEASAEECFQWGLIRSREGSPRMAIRWFERATWLRQDQFWYHIVLAREYLKVGEDAEHDEPLDLQHALAHTDVAIALRDDRPWPRIHRARIYRDMGSWPLAFDDLHEALRLLKGEHRLPVLLDLGDASQALGDQAGARAAYAEVITRAGPTSPRGRVARMRLAGLDLEAGRWAEAWAQCNSLLSEDPNDSTARYQRALVGLRSGHAADALDDLSHLIRQNPGHADWWADRALANLQLGRATEADADAAEAQQLLSNEAHDRLRTRTRLALGRDRDLRLTDPAELLRLPWRGAPLRANLEALATRLEEANDLLGLTNRAVVLAALGRRGEAFRAADDAVARSMGSTRAYLVRVILRLFYDDIAGAMNDIDEALRLEPDNVRFIGLRGQVELRRGALKEALRDFELTLRHRVDAELQASNATALMALQRYEAAPDSWTVAITIDPDEPRYYIGRARTFRYLQQWDQMIADLESAASRVSERPELNLQIALEYVPCLPYRPQRLGRVLQLTSRGLAGLMTRSGP